jgi:tetratricopeptide (TPR) repeat protein
MARLVVRYPGDAEVRVDGATAGRTNRVIPILPGDHEVRLVDKNTDPPSHRVTATAGADVVLRVAFQHARPAIDRFSRLYCAYNGFLLGQFLTLAFEQADAREYLVRRGRMLEFLREINVPLDIPEAPPGLGSEVHVNLINAVLPRIAERSKPLADFLLLGSLLTHHTFLADPDPETADKSIEVIDGVRARHKLPQIDLGHLRFDPERSAENALSPLLAYLGKIVDTLEVEHDTAFVIMPFKQPYASYYSMLYRPALESVGYRAFRAWGGLGSEDYCDLVLKLIAKCGLVWADASELNHNVLYEIGAAHALGKLSMIVVRDEDAASTPANIGHDAIVRYDPRADDWPEGTVALMAMLISTLKFAAESGKRLRVTPDSLQGALDFIGRRLVALLTPPEAKAAHAAGWSQLNAGDFAAAARGFDEAVRLGLDDHATLLGRGWSRVALERYAEAEVDFDAVLKDIDNSDEASRTTVGLAAYFRGVAREQQGRLEDARADYTLAIELGTVDAEVYRHRASVMLALGLKAEARQDADHARRLAPDDEETKSLEAALAAAGA